MADCDLLVIGSGAAGLGAAVTASALGLDVIVAERANVLGGTTAWSGGWMWLPCNPLAVAAGMVDQGGAPRLYLQSVLGERFDGERIDAFLAAAPEMVQFMTEIGFRFEAGNSICDIYANQPGAGTGGRSLIAAPFDGRRLGKRIAMLRQTKRETALLGMPIQAGADLGAFFHATRRPGAALHAAVRIARHLRDLALHGRAMQLRNGVALVARLFQLGEQHGVRWLTDARAVALQSANSKVIGATFETSAGERTITARKGVLLACGGSSQSRHFPAAGNHASLAVPEADGSAGTLAAPLGARFDRSLVHAGAWCPVSHVAWPDGTKGLFPHIVERGKPGVIAVRSDGRRFVNEADGYHDYVNALLAATPPGEAARSWLVCDHGFLRRWGLGVAKPWPLPIRHWLRSGYLKRAETLAELARTCGIDPTLAVSVEEFNRHAARGEDPQFHRGWSPYNRNQGDPACKPNPNVAPIAKAPFYAVEVVPGSFGSFQGLSTDDRARVLRDDGSPIAGLYAAGADAASVMGGHYPAGGINLGPAMTFGYIAAMEAASSGQ